MPNIYYYTCPIKALYMMKEFGIQINQRDSDPGKPLTTTSLTIKEMMGDILQYWNPRYEKENRLYVAPESEHIFEPKDGDLGIGYHTDLWQFDKGRWVFSTDEEYRTEREYFIKNIIQRDNKQFFMPEVVND